jgi:type II secretory pathway component GspD/PulD (secretin)
MVGKEIMHIGCFKKMNIKTIIFLILVLINVTAFASDLIDLDVKDADIRETIEKIARKASINIIVSPKVKGKITCLVKQMDARELIVFIARANGFEVEDRGRIIVVMAGKSSGKQVRVEVISLQYGNSAEVSKIIQNIRRDKNVRITHDERTNRLILVYDE